MTRTAALALVALLAAAGCEEAPAPEPIRPVRAIVVADPAGFQARPLPGRVKATQEVDLAFEVSGQLAERPVDVGDAVEQGRILARLDPRDYQNALDAARAARDRAKALRDRVAIAARTGAVSQQDLTDAQARLDETQAAVNIRQKAVDDTYIVAPFHGKVSETYVDNFQNVSAKQPVIRLLDVSTLEMMIDVPESSISLAPYVREVRIRFDAHPEREISASIKKIGNEASRTTRTYPVTLSFEPPADFEVLPGMAGEAKARIEVPADVRERGIEVPVGAVFSPADDPSQKSFVWVVAGEPVSVSRREVAVVERTPRGVLVQGLQPGERIATAGVHSLREGQPVRLAD
jgi:RND family efflux transporter MFP subunit